MGLGRRPGRDVLKHLRAGAEGTARRRAHRHAKWALE